MKPTDNLAANNKSDNQLNLKLVVYGIILILFIITLTTACSSTPASIPEDLSPLEYFQKAQEAVSSRNDLKAALSYYEAFVERFPEDPKRIEALYEIGFIHYKLKEYDLAKEKFNSLLQIYKTPEATQLPRWPYTLTLKHLEALEEE